MTTVTATFKAPDGTLLKGPATFLLVDSGGRPVKNAFLSDGTVVGEVQRDVVNGVYASPVVLTGNADIASTADATFWRRWFDGAYVDLQVPTSGTWDERQIAANPSPVAPSPVGTNLLSSATITTAVTGLVVDAFTFATVAGTLVTVPDLNHGVKIEACAPIVCPATANIDVAGFITNMTSATNVAADYHWAGTANLPYTARPFVVLPGHSAGNYQLKVYSFSSVTLKVDAQTTQPAGLWVYAI